jgi:hypothetical protein
MTGFALLMLAYQAWRVADYISGSLKDVSSTVSILIAAAFLAFSEIGLLIWLHVAQPNATTDAQESTAAAMIWVDFIGSMVIGLADLAKHNTMYIVDLSSIDPLLFIAPWTMVVLNIGGYLVYFQNDSEAKLDREERRLRHEENRLEMEARRAAIRELQNNKEAIAKELSPHYYKDVRDRVTGRTIARFRRQAKKDDEFRPSPFTGDFSFTGKNGKATYSAEVEQQDPRKVFPDYPVDKESDPNE